MNIYAAEPDAFAAEETQLLADLADDVAYGLSALRGRAERQRAEEALRAQEQRFRALIENSADAIALFDPEGTILYASLATKTILGYAPAEVVGHSVFEFIHPDLRDSLRDRLAKSLRSPKDLISACTQALHKDGSLRYLEGTLTSLLEDPAVGAIVVNYRDTTARKRAEEALFEEKERAQVTLHSIGDAVITTDANAIIEYLNPVAEALTGWTTAEARGQPLSAAFHIINEQTRQPAPDPVARCLQEGKIVGLANHTVLIDRHGWEYHVDDSAAPFAGGTAGCWASCWCFTTSPRTAG